LFYTKNILPHKFSSFRSSDMTLNYRTLLQEKNVVPTSEAMLTTMSDVKSEDLRSLISTHSLSFTALRKAQGRFIFYLAMLM
jgi:hypothetical protein